MVPVSRVNPIPSSVVVGREAILLALTTIARAGRRMPTGRAVTIPGRPREIRQPPSLLRGRLLSSRPRVRVTKTPTRRRARRDRPVRAFVAAQLFSSPCWRRLLAAFPGALSIAP